MTKTNRYPSTLLMFLTICGATLTANAGPVTEAPTGFDTPTLVQNPGSQSQSNGIAPPLTAPADTFALDQQVFEREHDVTDGLGPLYNARACADCHQNPVSGGASQFTELRVGHLDPTTGLFVNPTITINDGVPINGVVPTITGRSIVNDRAVDPRAQEHIPATENIRALRAVLGTLGDGFVEAIDDLMLQGIAARQPLQSYGRIHGEAVSVTMFESPGQTRIGRFGWKDQHGSLLSFAADAYLNEMGITGSLRPKDTTTIGKVTQDPEDTPDGLGMEDIDHFAQFIRGTKAPPRDPMLVGMPDTGAGEALFGKIGCAICHVPMIQTAPVGTVIINGGVNGRRAFAVPAALGDKTIHPYGDYLLHDIGTGDGIVQGGPADTRLKLRTAPLWGLRMKARFMHDLRSLSLEDAIERHRGEADYVSDQFLRLSPTEKQQIITFLNSL